jgi:hypothetical protein
MRREQQAEAAQEALRRAEEQALLGYEAEFPADLREAMEEAHIERRRDESVGVVAVIRDRMFRLSRHAGEHEEPHWQLEIQTGEYRRANLGDDFLLERGLGLDALLAIARSIERNLVGDVAIRQIARRRAGL